MNMGTSLEAIRTSTRVGCVASGRSLALSHFPPGLSIPMDRAPHSRHNLSDPPGCL
jgi:hypothetical protein